MIADPFTRTGSGGLWQLAQRVSQFCRSKSIGALNTQLIPVR